MAESLKYTLDTHMYRWKDFSPIQFRVYDSVGKLVAGWEYCFGSLKKLNLITGDSLVSKPWLPLNRALNIYDDVNLIAGGSCSGDTLNIHTFKDYNYIIIAFWASYYGQGAKRMLQYIEDFQRNSRKKVLFIKVNYDGSDE
ncbi:MAG: hypothetical protein QM642_09800 [Edaphocola sp.]